jgi:hypothetical protein
VLVEQLTPRGIAEALSERRRVDDIGDEDGGKDPLVGSRGGPAVHANPLQRHDGLVADDPRVVTGRR